MRSSLNCLSSSFNKDNNKTRISTFDNQSFVLNKKNIEMNKTNFGKEKEHKEFKTSKSFQFQK